MAAFAHDPIDCSDAALAEAYARVGDRDHPDNWALFSLDRSRLEVLASGRGGLPELREALDERAGDRVVFGAFQVVATDIVARHRLVYVQYVGPRVEAVRKTAALIQAPEASRFFKGVSLEIDVKNVESQLDEAEIARRLLSGGASHKPSAFDFGGGVVVRADELDEAGDESDSSID